MPKIVEECPYNGVIEKISRLGLTPLMVEVREILTGFQLLVLEEKDKNGGAAIRKLIDLQFAKADNWKKKQTGDVDWTKCKIINGTKVCIGIEIQFSARSDLIIRDIVHLRKAIVAGAIDIGILVVPTDKLSYFATDRGPSITAGKRVVDEMNANALPLILIAIEHDGPGPALAKERTRQGRLKED